MVVVRVVVGRGEDVFCRKVVKRPGWVRRRGVMLTERNVASLPSRHRSMEMRGQ